MNDEMPVQPLPMPPYCDENGMRRIAELEAALRAITYRADGGAVLASYNPGFDLRKVAPILDTIHTKE